MMCFALCLNDKGLTPKMFWENFDELLGAPDIEDCILELKKRSEQQFVDSAKSSEGLDIGQLKSHFCFIGNSGLAFGDHVAGVTLIAHASNMKGTTEDVWKLFDIVINCSEVEYTRISPRKENYFQIQLEVRPSWLIP